ncbi:DUF2249 domain-containing protein [Janthinobacterium fluminis]|uniref:DUF2249 domain-containing protein n=1 Tax=Janthinobacterium fluminis TaxID=2987524 RepID=A0ABT5JWC7_9BURK|nr:DUF2249 domain-containing protein [Janthinobacterium fluminis]MDC8757043.1 DUF2249 domain-containing protein [Janthinobacterium fluminis]
MQEIPLDVCGLEPPGPMEQILAALGAMAPQDRLAVLIERDPLPLYRILDRHGYHHRIAQRPDRRYDLLIWRAA